MLSQRLLVLVALSIPAAAAAACGGLSEQGVSSSADDGGAAPWRGGPPDAIGDPRRAQPEDAGARARDAGDAESVDADASADDSDGAAPADASTDGPEDAPHDADDADATRDAGAGDDAAADAGAVADAGGLDASRDAGVIPPDGGFCDEPDLFAHFRFDEGKGSKAADCTSNQLVLTATGGGVFGYFGFVPGKSGTAAGFGGAPRYDQNDALVLSQQPTMAAGAYSISAWVYLRGGLLFNFTAGTIVRRGVMAYGYRLEVDGRAPRFSANGRNGVVNVASPDDLPLETWVHVAVTSDPVANETRLYVGGVVTATAPSAPEPSDPKGALMVGGRLNQQTLHGRVDEVRIYTRALSQAEITALAGE